MSHIIEDKAVITYLVRNSDYFLKVIPFISSDLFGDSICRKTFNVITKYYEKYNQPIVPGILLSEIEKIPNLSDNDHTALVNLYSDIDEADNVDNTQWLLDETEKWIRHRQYWNSIASAADEYDKGKLDGELSEKINNCLGFSFDTTVGAEFSEAEKRYELYTKEEERIQCDLSMLNMITGGGVTRKTMNIWLSSNSGGGKSLAMCHLAKSYLMLGYNVLYITLEMAEEKIMERIDANSLDVPINKLKELGKDEFVNRITAIQSKTKGKLFVKQYPTSSANANHFKNLINELYLKKKFKPDILIIDYINICSSSRCKGTDNSYNYIKSIAEELRGLCVETNTVLWTATQSNRNGSGNLDMAVTDVSESYGIVFTADIILGLITNEELDAAGLIKVKQLKNRYGDINYYNSFQLKITKEKMRLEDVDNGVTYNAEVPEKIEEKEETTFRSAIKSRVTLGSW